VISVKEIESLATMPSKEELYSKLLFLMNAPAQRLVTAMNAVGRDLAVVIGQGVEQKKVQGSVTQLLASWLLGNRQLEASGQKPGANTSF
jgi:hypothetical protein